MADQNSQSRAVRPLVWAVVIALYTIYVAVAFVGFASYMVRIDWEASLTPENSSASDSITNLDTILFALKRENDLISQMETDKLTESSARAQENKVLATRQRLLASRTEFNTLQSNIASSIYSDLRLAAADLPDEARKTLGDFTRVSEQNQTARADEAFGIFESRAKLAGVSTAVISAVDDRIHSRLDQIEKTRLEEFATYDTERDFMVEITRLDSEVERMKNRIERANLELEAIKFQIPMSSPNRARFAALGLSVGGGNLLQEMVKFPTIFLTLIVTVAMGGLGSLVAVSRDQLQGGDHNLSLSRLFVRLVEGIAAAFAIFLLSGAGLLALSQGSTGAGGISLSPYSVAFVAFVSGLMAENAFGAVRQAGRRILRADNQRDN